VKLVELLAPERVVVPLDAPTLADAARQLVEAVITGGMAADPDRLRGLLAELRPREFVPVGSQGCLVQVRSDAVRRLAVAVGVSAKPVPRKAGGVKGVRAVVLVLAPPKEASASLQVVSAVGRVLGRRDTVSSLLEAGTPAHVLASPALREVEVTGELLVRDFMSRDLQTLRPEATVDEAASLLVRRGLTAVPVVSENNEVLGMLGHRDLLRVLLPQYVKRVTTGEFVAPPRPGRPGGAPLVSDVMDRSVLCLSEDQSLAEAASVMVSRDRDRLPVVRDGVLVGVISRSDIVTRICGP
jgi:CBS domain-containing protein